MAQSSKALIVAFCSAVLALAIFQFSETTADPDLWGHIIFGQNHIKTGVLDKAEPYSWTAQGYPWINHEVGAELALAAAHFAGGGMGVLLLKVFVGILTFLIAIKVGGRDLSWPWRAVTWAVGAIAVVEISFGFAARPQIFTALGLATQIWLLRRIYAGCVWSVGGLFLLFVVWINTHGGALAGVALMWASVGATVVEFWASRLNLVQKWILPAKGSQTLIHMGVAGALASVALFLNPWGTGLVEWLIGSVLWLRPEIEEWNPTRLNWDHGTFFIMVLLTIVSFLFSRKKRALWEMAFCGALMVLAFRSVRHTPLFCVAALALIPPHLADVLERFFGRLRERDALFAPSTLKIVTLVFALLTPAILWASVALHKENRLTMEVAKKQYPMEAIRFIQKHKIQGNLIVFFDWGELALWELPESPVSIDGRLDTCYPRRFLTEHWKFFNGEPIEPALFDLSRADFALLPSSLAGAFTLKNMEGWKPVYVDNLAVVLVHRPDRFPALNGIKLPTEGPDNAMMGRLPFPEQNPRWAVK